MAHDQDMVIAIGNTGCGKSTMFSSLLYGPDALEKKAIFEEVEILAPSDKDKNKRVSVKKQIKRFVIDTKEKLEKFKIGHSQNTSETFLPSFHLDKVNDVVYGDIAGLQDTQGGTIQFVNSFVSKEIFRQCKSIRFIVAFTQAQLIEARGQMVRKQLKVVQEICRKYLSDERISLIPVITKCNIEDQDLDLDSIVDNLREAIKGEIKEQLIEVNNSLKSKSGQRIQANADAQIQQLQDFYEKIADTIIVFDPLDRNFINEQNDDYSRKRDEFVQDILKAPKMDGKELCIPMDRELLSQMDQIYRDVKEKYSEIAERAFQKAKDQGMSYKENFKEVREFKELFDAVKFFSDHELTVKSQKEFQIMIEFIAE